MSTTPTLTVEGLVAVMRQHFGAVLLKGHIVADRECLDDNGIGGELDIAWRITHGGGGPLDETYQIEEALTPHFLPRPVEVRLSLEDMLDPNKALAEYARGVESALTPFVRHYTYGLAPDTELIAALGVMTPKVLRTLTAITLGEHDIPMVIQINSIGFDGRVNKVLLAHLFSPVQLETIIKDAQPKPQGITFRQWT